MLVCICYGILLKHERLVNIFHAILHILENILHEAVHDTRLVDNICSVHFCQGFLTQFRQILCKSLQHLLMILKALLLHLLRFISQVVSKGVRVFQDTTTLNKLFVGSLEELDIRPTSIIRRFLEEHHSRFCFLELLLGKGLGLRVCVVALVVVKVSVEFTLGLGSIRVVIFVVAAAVGIKLVAFVITAAVEMMILLVLSRNSITVHTTVP